jgi:fructosamine-3-kinase
VRPDRLFVKTREPAPPGFCAAAAAGLAWLAEAADGGGVTTLRPVSVDAQRLVLPYVHQRTPTSAQAEAFGRALALTHRSGAPHHGSPPRGWTADGWIATLPLPHVSQGPGAGWGAFYAAHRVAPFARSSGLADDPGVRRLCDRLAAEDEELVGPAEPPSRLHGDLWSGNVLWSADGAVLVDPAAHGGHRETDLAMLALFGLPHLDRVLAAYDETAPLSEGWRDRVALHQVHPLLVHAALFGGAYGSRAVAAARRYV